MAKTKRRSKSKSCKSKSSKSKSCKSKSSKSKRGGFGGWGRQTLVGAAWNPPANNTYRDMTAPSARSNHFSLSRYGGAVGGIQPAVQGNYGPGPHQINPLVPPRLGGGGKPRRGGQRGGGDSLYLGGFPQLIGNAWDKTMTGFKNVINGYNGVKLLPPPSPWNQPELVKPMPPLKTTNNNNSIQAALKAATNAARL